jgi:hypothetical protein
MRTNHCREKRKLNRPRLCACGAVGTIYKWGCWACARCIEIENRLESYHPTPDRTKKERTP